MLLFLKNYASPDRYCLTNASGRYRLAAARTETYHAKGQVHEKKYYSQSDQTEQPQPDL